eukprot:CAMPEP_0184303158 /NCGR_PEP_ID=MMETSP1049-20130417/12953_1 /TAXON_ID=77928 /ORGANISM="Proteomonas sulcata, Strain CCMP704" /LENGTH=66 /DNA_ID=CAMNT_0026614613 /DNA_START=209 /DNA_END=409 /DNA_ORIENTATION=-
MMQPRDCDILMSTLHLMQFAPSNPREECSIFSLAALRVGDPRMRQNRKVSSAAADTMVVPSGLCAM